MADAMDVDEPVVKEELSGSAQPASAGAPPALAGLSKKFEAARDRVAADKFDVVRLCPAPLLVPLAFPLSSYWLIKSFATCRMRGR